MFLSKQKIDCEGNNTKLQKEKQLLARLQQQQLSYHKQIYNLYTKLSQIYERGNSLSTRKNELQFNKIHINSTQNISERDLSKQLLGLRQSYKQSQSKYTQLKKEVINNSLKIKETVKEIHLVKEIIESKQNLYEKMKRQTELLKENQANNIQILRKLQEELTKQSIRTISFLKGQAKQNKQYNTEEVLRKIAEMQKINETLNSILTL